MNKDELLLQLYQGREIIREQFDRYFVANGFGGKQYIAYIGDEYPNKFELHASISGNIVTNVELFRPTTHGGSGRAMLSDGGLTATQKKTAYEILDACFKEQAADEIEAVIDQAVSTHAEYNGFRTVKRVNDGVQFISPEGKRAKLATLTILRALDYSHQDIRILREAETAKRFVAIFGKTAYEPLFAILQTVNADTYPNYNELENEYHFELLKEALSSGDREAAARYIGSVSAFPKRIATLCEELIKAETTEMLVWFLQETKNIDYNLAPLISETVKQNKKAQFDLLLETGKYLPDPPERVTWDSAVYRAVNEQARDRYLLPLLQHGYCLPAKTGKNYYNTCSLDAIKEVLFWDIVLDEETVDRIISEKRWDIVELIEQELSKISGTEALLKSIAHSAEYEHFKEGIHKGYKYKTIEVFTAAFANGAAWADLLLENGFDLNMENGQLLAQACWELNEKLVEYLLKHGAVPHSSGSLGSTCIELASAFHDYDSAPIQARICKQLMEHGADPILDCHAAPSCISRMLDYSKEFREYLVDWMIEHNRLNEPDTCSAKDDKHVLLYHLLGGRDKEEELIEKVLDHGARANADGITKDKLFVRACSSCSIKILAKMLDHGANINEEENGATPLFQALWMGADLEKTRFLVEHGAEVNYYRPAVVVPAFTPYRKPARSVLDVAREKCTADVVEYLISCGAKTGEELGANAAQ